MAAEREAGIRVTIRKDGAIQSLRDISRETERFTRDTRSGLESSQRAAAGLVGTLRQGIGTAASFFGLHAGVGMVRDAMRIREEFQGITFSLEAGRGVLKTWQSTFGDVLAANRQWGRGLAETTRAYALLNEELGGAPDDLAKILEKVGRAATASGKPIEQLANLGAIFAEKWEIPVDQMDTAFRTALSLTNQGGIKLDEFMSAAPRLGPKLRKAGLSGVDNLAQVMGFMNRAEGAIATPRQGAMAMGSILELLTGDSTEKIQQLRKAGVAGHLIQGSQAIKDPFAMMREIVAATGGKRERIEAGFGKSSPVSDVLTELARPFREAAEGEKDAAKKRAAGLAAYDAAVEQSKRVMLSKSRYDEIAAEKSKDAAANLERAKGQIMAAFTRPEFLNAASRAATALSDLAIAATKLLDSPLGKKGLEIADKLGPEGMLGIWGGSKVLGKLWQATRGAATVGAAEGAGGGALAAGAKGLVAKGGVGSLGLGLSLGALGIGMALGMEGDGYNPEATLDQKEKALRRYRTISKFADGSRSYELMRSIERSPSGGYAYRKKIMDEKGNLLDVQAITEEQSKQAGGRDYDDERHRMGPELEAGSTSALRQFRDRQATASRGGLPARFASMALGVAADVIAADERERRKAIEAGRGIMTGPVEVAPVNRAADAMTDLSPLLRLLSGTLRVEVVNGRITPEPARGGRGGP